MLIKALVKNGIKINYLINGCINVEQNNEIIIKINNAITKQNSNKIKINFIEEENKIKEFPQIIKSLEIYILERIFNLNWGNVP